MTIITRTYAMLKIETSPQFARRLLLEELKKRNGKVAPTARAFDCSRDTVYLALAKQAEGSLADGSHAPKAPAHKTAESIESQVVQTRKETGFGKRRLRWHLLDTQHLELPESTIGKILKRLKLTHKKQRVRREPKPSYDFASLLPFEACEMDTKEIADKKGLGADLYRMFLDRPLPRWQWTFIDVVTRMRFLAWSYQCSWTNGQIFINAITWWLRSFGFNGDINVGIDGGREWHANLPGAFSRSLTNFYWPKRMYPRVIRKGHPEDNPFVERSHGTDDTELYVPHLGKIKTEQQFIYRAAWWQKVYNLYRPHMGIGDRNPYQQLRRLGFVTPPQFANFPTLILDRLGSSPLVFPELKSVGYHLDYDQNSERDWRIMLQK